jgi:hypothetical protein
MNSEFVAAMLEPVTALAAGTKTSTYCFSSDNGNSSLKRSPGVESVVVGCGYIGATHLAISNDEELIACAEIEGILIVWRVTESSDGTLSRPHSFMSKTPVQQLQFDLSDKYLLIRPMEHIAVLSMTTGLVEST